MFAQSVETLHLPSAICLCLSQSKMIHTNPLIVPTLKYALCSLQLFATEALTKRYTEGQLVHAVSPAVLCFFTAQCILHNVIRHQLH
jgi:hypothetical protein